MKMNIIFYTRLFYPKGGGSINIVDMLCDHWVSNGHIVKVITTTSVDGFNDSEKSYEVIREPSKRKILSEFKKCDKLFFMENSFAMLFAILVRKKYVVTHQANFYIKKENVTLKQKILWKLGDMGTQIACSDFIASQRKSVSFQVIGNPFEDKIYSGSDINHLDRKTDICFVGRLTNEKGII